jgi:hypothetical protein
MLKTPDRVRIRCEESEDRFAHFTDEEISIMLVDVSIFKYPEFSVSRRAKLQYELKIELNLRNIQNDY